SQRCRRWGRGSCFQRRATSSTDRWAAARVTPAIVFLLLPYITAPFFSLYLRTPVGINRWRLFLARDLTLARLSGNRRQQPQPGHIVGIGEHDRHCTSDSLQIGCIGGALAPGAEHKNHHDDERGQNHRPLLAG